MKKSRKWSKLSTRLTGCGLFTYKDLIREFGWMGDPLLPFCHNYMDLEREEVGMATVTHARNVYLLEPGLNLADLLLSKWSVVTKKAISTISFSPSESPHLAAIRTKMPIANGIPATRPLRTPSRR
jgi:hypothetical protein